MQLVGPYVRVGYVSEKLLPRIPIIEVFPVIEDGTLPAKATEGEPFPIRATVFREGHDAFAAEAVLLRPDGGEYSRTRMVDIAPGLDRYEAWVAPDAPGAWTFRVDSWSDPYATWRHDAAVKVGAGIDVELMLEEGARLMERAAAGSAFHNPTQEQPPALGHRSAARRRTTPARHQPLPPAAPIRRHFLAYPPGLPRPPAARPPRLLARPTRSTSPAPRRWPARGTKSSHALQAPTRTPTAPGSRAPLRARCRRPASHRRYGLRRRLSDAHPPDRHHLPQRQEQLADRDTRRPRIPLRHRLTRRRPRRHPPGSGYLR